MSSTLSTPTSAQEPGGAPSGPASAGDSGVGPAAVVRIGLPVLARVGSPAVVRVGPANEQALRGHRLQPAERGRRRNRRRRACSRSRMFSA